MAQSRSCYYRQTWHHVNKFLQGYEVDDAFVALRKRQYPQTFQVTKEVLVCDSMSLMGTGCSYRGPRYNASAEAFGEGGPVIIKDVSPIRRSSERRRVRREALEEIGRGEKGTPQQGEASWWWDHPDEQEAAAARGSAGDDRRSRR